MEDIFLFGRDLHFCQLFLGVKYEVFNSLATNIEALLSFEKRWRFCDSNRGVLRRGLLFVFWLFIYLAKLQTYRKIARTV